ncbi:MAG TPA: hypothetical protein VK988_10115 [Acidimicrobiales bacterium]|nr:hypothetical protein [Acidimicrobiales bacterium]
MPDDLTGVGIKLDRAEVHLKAIHADINQFINKVNSSKTTHGGIDPFNQDWQVIRWKKVPTIDARVGAVLGDFVHNVRSALDQLMWSLVLANGGKPGKHTQWPVSETEGKWRDDIVERQIEKRGPSPTTGLSDDALNFVLDFQPFRRGTFLLELHRLSNEDKHRTLHAGVPVLTQGPFGLRLTPPGYLAFTKMHKPRQPMPVEYGTPFVRVKVRRLSWPPPEGVNVQVAFDGAGVDVGFYAGPRFIAAMSQLEPMLKVARKIRGTALELAEIIR